MRSTLLSTCLVLTADRSYFLIINTRVKDKTPLMAMFYFLIIKPVRLPKVDMKRKDERKAKRLVFLLPFHLVRVLILHSQ